MRAAANIEHLKRKRERLALLRFLAASRLRPGHFRDELARRLAVIGARREESPAEGESAAEGFARLLHGPVTAAELDRAATELAPWPALIRLLTRRSRSLV